MRPDFTFYDPYLTRRFILIFSTDLDSTGRRISRSPVSKPVSYIFSMSFHPIKMLFIGWSFLTNKQPSFPRKVSNMPLTTYCKKSNLKAFSFSMWLTESAPEPMGPSQYGVTDGSRFSTYDHNADRHARGKFYKGSFRHDYDNQSHLLAHGNQLAQRSNHSTLVPVNSSTILNSSCSLFLGSKG